ncbi:MAG TPA: glutathione-disulfide reductase [Polyangiaceae bacterium]|nr:glutathione-disulfide reductase [Polyangiaceae bacterium]
MSKHGYDLLVLGGGSGGLAAARRAASYGVSAAIIEGAELGGTCVNRGCVPKKIVWNLSRVLDSLHDAKGYSLGEFSPQLDYRSFKNKRDQYVARLNAIYERNLGVDGVTLIRGWGKIEGPNTIRVTALDGSEQTVTGKHLLIATGSAPERPNIPGAELGETSDDFFAWETLPRRVAIVGAGYIAVELASALSHLGVDVSLIIRHERLLRRFDRTITDELIEQMTAAGVSMITGFTAQRLERTEQGLTLTSETGHVEGGYEHVIWAIGRRGRIQDLGLERVGVPVENGFVITDEWQATRAVDIFALGDVTGKNELTPVAIAAGRKLADRLYGGKADARLDYTDVPTVIFSHPPVASVGLSEEEALERFEDGVKCYRTRFFDMYYGLTERRTPTVMKLVTVGATEKVVGIHLIGRNCDEIIQGFAVALKMGATKADLDRTVAIHPTAAEELVTMR